MIISQYRHPVLFYGFSTAIPWAFWFGTHRSVLVAVVFHITASCFNELFCTHPDSKVIQTVLLLVLSIVVVMKNQDFFLRRDYQEDGTTDR